MQISRQPFLDIANVWQETQIQHLVGFIDNVERVLAKRMAPVPMWSSNLPGVATTTSTPALSTPNLPPVIPAIRTWSRGRITGQKRLVLPKHVWAIRVRLELAESKHDHALFNMLVTSKLRGRDLAL